MIKRKQKWALWIGILLTLAMGLYPPWILEVTADDPSIRSLPFSVQYGWLIAPPSGPPDLGFWFARLDMSRLVVQWVLVWTITTALLWTLRQKQSSVAGLETVSASSTSGSGAPHKTTAERTAIRNVRTPQCETIRQKLRPPLLYDEVKIDALVAFERQRAPNATEEQLHLAAYERWLRDNR